MIREPQPNYLGGKRPQKRRPPVSGFIYYIAGGFVGSACTALTYWMFV